MANGEETSLKILQDEIQEVLDQEKNVDFNQCDVSPLVPQGMFLLLKIQKYTLQQTAKKFNMGVVGATGGIGAFITFLVDAIASRM